MICASIGKLKINLPARALLCLPLSLAAESPYLAPKPPDIEWTQQIGGQLPLDAQLRNAQDKTVKLGEYFGDGPVLLMLGYNRCPMLCGEQIQGLLQTLEAAPSDAFSPFTMLFLSVDPDEATALAREAQRTAGEALAATRVPADWTFLRGGEPAVRAVAEAAGFAYREYPETGEIAHPAGFLVAQADGTISRYLFGVRFEPRDLRLALLDAEQGKVARAADQLLMLCFHYDPLTGRYGLAIARFIKAGSLFTLLLLGSWIGWHLWKERRARRA